MGWKREQFKRRVRELAAEHDSSERAYVPLQEIADDNAYSWDRIWDCLSKAWQAGQSTGKPPLELRDEAEAWLAQVGARRPRLISQAFIDTKLWDRIWNNKCEMSRFEMVSKMLCQSERGTEKRHEELESWYSDIVTEFADIYKTRSVMDANYAIGGWAEMGGILARLWSLYEKGPRATGDRNMLRELVLEISNASPKQAEGWISSRENMEDNPSEQARMESKNR